MTTKRRWALVAVVALTCVGLAGLGLWLRDSVLAWRGLEPSPALGVAQAMGRGHGVSASQGRFLHDAIVQGRYTRGLDLGTAHGYAALWMGMALRRNGGTLDTVEIDEDTARRARENFRRAGMEGVITLHVADALEQVPRLSGDFDFVFMDLGVPLNGKLYAMLRDRIRPGGTIAAHNAEMFRWAQPDYLHAIETDPDFETSYHGLIFRISRTVRRR
jgi:predicted O-methyltransferase YrrM